MKTPTGYIGVGFDSHRSETFRSCQRMIELHAPRILREHGQENRLVVGLTQAERRRLFELGATRGGLEWRDPESAAMAAEPISPKVERKPWKHNSLPLVVHDQVAALLEQGKSYNAICAECGVSKAFVSRTAVRRGLRRKPAAAVDARTRFKKSAIRAMAKRERALKAEQLREQIYCAFDRCERRADIGKKHGLTREGMRVRWLRYCRIGGPRRHLQALGVAA